MKTRNRIFSTLAILFATVVGYQNCGRMASIDLDSDELVAPKTLSEIGYPYTEKPTFFHSVVLYKTDTKVARLSEFKFVGSLAYVADETKDITYEIRIRDEIGTPMCPAKTGVLTAGSSTIEFDCLSMTTSSEAYIEIKAKAGTVEETIKELI